VTLEKLKKFEKYIKISLLSLIFILLYFFLPMIQGIFFELFGVNTENLPMNITIFYSIICDILMIALIILLFNKSIKKDFKDIKKNDNEYYSKYFKYYLIGLFIMMISNLIISFISNGSNAGNQETIEEMFDKAPVYIYCSAVFFAPIVEELVFRRAIKNIIPNSLLFILTSGLIFGGLHIIGTIEAWYDILYLIPYSSLGIVFAYILQKTNNIFVTIGLHFMHNGILMALEVFVLLFS